MSKAEIDRLSEDISHNHSLRLELESVEGESEEIARWARTRGYEVANDEVNGLRESEELSDDDLEAVAGGWTGEPDP
jgi:predicted ribosomally synthesized peptide with nif11-like leader